MRLSINLKVLGGFLAILLALVAGQCSGPAPLQARQSDGPQPAAISALSFDHIIVDGAPPASYRINDIQIGDIDGDGENDIWTSGRGPGPNPYEMVWYKNPSWNRYEIAAGDFKYGALGDFDGDLDLDVVAGKENDSKVYWYENNGNPEQKDWPEHDLGVTGQPDLFYVGDIDLDGRDDVIYLYKGQWGWAKNPLNPVNTWTAYDIWQGADRAGGDLADLDLDGDLDLVYGNGWFENPLPGGDPTNGPSWTLRLIDPGWPSEARAAIGDLSGDGRPDVVLTDEEGGAGIAWYRAPLSPSTGNWTKFTVIASGYQGIHSLQLADFDRDEDLDIMAAEMHTGANPDKVTVFLNVDSANNVWQENVIANFGSHNAKAGLIDGDLYPDIVGKNFEAGELPLRVDLWLNNPPIPNAWTRHVIDEARPWKAVFVAGGDINGDSLPDVISGGWWYQNPGNLGAAWTRHTIGGELYNMALVLDLDGDLDLDILGTKGQVNSDEFVWAQNNGTGGFTIHDNLPTADGDFLQGAAAGQITPGGLNEIVLSWHNATSTQMFEIASPPTNPWAWSALSATSNGEEIAIGDVDDDGDQDIHLGTEWLRNEGGSWTTLPAFTLSNPQADPDRVRLADVDGDGDLDVVVGAEHAKMVVWAEAPSNPANAWIEHVITTDSFGMSMDVGDIDKDGDPDVVIGEHNTADPDVGRVLIFLNDDDGQSWFMVQADTGLEHHDGTQFIDIDLDGDLDIISIGWLHNKVVVYENLGGGLPSQVWLAIVRKPSGRLLVDGR